MKTKQRYSMPKGRDRTYHARLRGMREDAIDYSDIPPLDDPAWAGRSAKRKTAYHVIPADSGWTVRRSGSGKGLASFASKAAAVRSARASARKDRTSLVVHNRDGSVRAFVSFASGD